MCAYFARGKGLRGEKFTENVISRERGTERNSVYSASGDGPARAARPVHVRRAPRRRQRSRAGALLAAGRPPAAGRLDRCPRPPGTGRAAGHADCTLPGGLRTARLPTCRGSSRKQRGRRAPGGRSCGVAQHVRDSAPAAARRAGAGPSESLPQTRPSDGSRPSPAGVPGGGPRAPPPSPPVGGCGRLAWPFPTRRAPAAGGRDGGGLSGGDFPLGGAGDAGRRAGPGARAGRGAWSERTEVRSGSICNSIYRDRVYQPVSDDSTGSRGYVESVLLGRPSGSKLPNELQMV